MKLKLKKIDGLIFEELDHTYTLNGKFLPGVTTILNAKAKDFLKWWSVKEGVKFLGYWDDKMSPEEIMFQRKTALNMLVNFQGLGVEELEEYNKILDEAKKAHTKKSKEALVSGKIAHEWIENFIKKLIETPLSEEKYLELIDEITKEMPKDKKSVASINAFINWCKEHEIIWYASEIKLASPTYEFAGTIDSVCRLDGKLTIVDFKTSNQISEEYYLQAAAYQILLNENLEDGEERPEQRLVLRIPKDGNGFEAKFVPTPLDLDIKTFLALREVRKWDSYVENNLK